MPGISIDFTRGRDIPVEAFQDAIDELFDWVVDHTPVRTGRLMRSWILNMNNDSAELINSQPYASYIDEGISMQAPNGLIGPALVEFQNLLAYYIGEYQDTHAGIVPILDADLSALNRY